MTDNSLDLSARIVHPVKIANGASTATVTEETMTKRYFSRVTLVCMILAICPSASSAESSDIQIARIALLESGRVLERGPWRQFVTSEEVKVRIEAIRAIGRVQDQNLAALIESNLGHQNESVRLAAATAYGQIKDMGPSALRDQLKVEKKVSVMDALLNGLGHRGAMEDAVYLLGALDGFANELRTAAILAVARIARTHRYQLHRLNPNWRTVLKPEDPASQRYAWAYLLTVWRDKLKADGKSALERCLNDSSIEIRLICVGALGHLPARSDERYAATKDPDWRVRVAAARALVKAKDYGPLTRRLNLLLDAHAAGTIKFEPPAAHEMRYLLDHAYLLPMDGELRTRLRGLYNRTRPVKIEAADKKGTPSKAIKPLKGNKKKADPVGDSPSASDAGPSVADASPTDERPSAKADAAAGEGTVQVGKPKAVPLARKTDEIKEVDALRIANENMSRAFLNCAAAALLDRPKGLPRMVKQCGGPAYPGAMREAWMVKATVDLAPERRAKKLKRLYRNFSTTGRLAVIDTLSDIPVSKTSESILTEAFNSQDEALVGASAAAISKHKLKHLGQQLVDPYKRAYKQGKHAAVQSIFETFGQLELVETHQILEGHCNDAQPGIRYTARSALKKVDRALRRLEKENGFVGVLGVRGRRSKIPPPADMMSGQTPDPRLASPPAFAEALLHTSAGLIHIRFFVAAARNTVKNFIKLAKRGFYNNLAFHRVIPGFVAQVGDPTGTGWGGPGYTIPCEYNGRPFLRGTLGMALSGKDTGGSQFFITQSRTPHLDGAYTAFAEVIDGQEVVDKITTNDQILRVELLSKQ